MENVRETREMITYIKGQKYKVVAILADENSNLVSPEEWNDTSRIELVRCWNTYNAATTFLTGMMDMHEAANPKTQFRSVATEEVPAEITRSINLLRTSFILNLTEYMLMVAPEWMERGVGFLDFEPPVMWEMKVWKYDKFGNLLSDEPYLLKLR